TLTFNGQTTVALSATSATLAADIQSALNNLSTVGGVGGSVNVSQLGNVFTVSFGGNFLAAQQPLILAAASGGAGVTVARTSGAGGGTLALAGANSFHGTTVVGQGSLLLENGQALGG